MKEISETCKFESVTIDQSGKIIKQIKGTSQEISFQLNHKQSINLVKIPGGNCRSAFRIGDIAHNCDHIVGLRVCFSK